MLLRTSRPAALALFVASIALAACALARNGALDQARRFYDDGDYREAIVRAERALSYGRPSVAERARVNLLKAQSHEKLGEIDQAVALYAYVAKTFPQAPEAYQAAVALGRLVPAAPARDDGGGF